MINNAVFILSFVFFVFLAGLFAGSETGLYQLSRLRLRLGIEKKQLLFVILGRIMHDRAGLLLSMLIGTNLAQYFATSIIANMFLAKVGGELIAGLFTTILTAPVLFVFSELIPKNIFFYRADLFMPYLAPVLHTFHKVFIWCGAVPVLKFVSGGFGRSMGLAWSSKTVITSVERHRVKAILQDTHEEGLFSSTQADMINRIVSIPGIRIEQVMIPVNNVEMVDVNSDRTALLSKLKKCPFTRLPVIEGQHGNIIGFVNIYEALSSSEQFDNLRDFIRPIRRLDAATTVIEAINIIQSENQRIILVVKTSRGGREKPMGIVTMKDLVEELLGELAEW
ncbi:MAG: CNNM domain-containing protein [Sedimentisphaerales bacterium]